eukprot:3506033-Rhodomonas_salina.1
MSSLATTYRTTRLLRDVRLSCAGDAMSGCTSAYRAGCLLWMRCAGLRAAARLAGHVPLLHSRLRHSRLWL